MNSKKKPVGKLESSKPDKIPAKLARLLREGHRDGVPGQIARGGKKSSARGNASASALLITKKRNLL